MATVYKISPKFFPKEFLKELVATIKFFESIKFDPAKYGDEMSELPRITDTSLDATLFRLKDKQFPKFYFKLKVVVNAEQKPQFRCSYFPVEQTTIKAKVFIVSTFSEVEGHYLLWTSLLKIYDDADALLNSDFEDNYFAEFYEEHKLDDENYETAPFRPEIQEVLYQRLTCLSNAIETIDSIDTEEKKNINAHIESTINNLGRFTKKQVIESLAKIRSKMQKWGPRIIKQMGEAVLKELAKEGVAKGMKALGDIFHHL